MLSLPQQQSAHRQATITMPIAFDDQNQPFIQIELRDVHYIDLSAPRVVSTLERISSSTAYPD